MNSVSPSLSLPLPCHDIGCRGSPGSGWGREGGDTPRPITTCQVHREGVRGVITCVPFEMGRLGAMDEVVMQHEVMWDYVGLMSHGCYMTLDVTWMSHDTGYHMIPSAEQTIYHNPAC